MISLSMERKQIFEFRKSMPFATQCIHNRKENNSSFICNGLIPFSRFEWFDACRKVKVVENKSVDCKRFDNIEDYRCPFILTNEGSYCRLLNKNRNGLYDARPLLCRILDYKSALSCHICSKKIIRPIEGIGLLASQYMDFLINNDVFSDVLLDPKTFLEIYENSGKELNQKIEQNKSNSEIKDSFLFQKLDK